MIADPVLSASALHLALHGHRRGPGPGRDLPERGGAKNFISIQFHFALSLQLDEWSVLRKYSLVSHA